MNESKKTLKEIVDFCKEFPNRGMRDGSIVELVNIISQLANEVYKDKSETKGKE